MTVALAHLSTQSKAFLGHVPFLQGLGPQPRPHLPLHSQPLRGGGCGRVSPEEMTRDLV